VTQQAVLHAVNNEKKKKKTALSRAKNDLKTQDLTAFPLIISAAQLCTTAALHCGLQRLVF
jgi:hypothetical protein